jgi:hypothetical protein
VKGIQFCVEFVVPFEFGFMDQVEVNGQALINLGLHGFGKGSDKNFPERELCLGMIFAKIKVQ